MNRTETIDRIKATLAVLPDEQLDALAELTRAWSAPSVYSQLSESEKHDIDAALDRFDAGEGVPWEDVKGRLQAKLRSSGP
jgi:hypothetical protein